MGQMDVELGTAGDALQTIVEAQHRCLLNPIQSLEASHSVIWADHLGSKECSRKEDRMLQLC